MLAIHIVHLKLIYHTSTSFERVKYYLKINLIIHLYTDQENTEKLHVGKELK